MLKVQPSINVWYTLRVCSKFNHQYIALENGINPNIGTLERDRVCIFIILYGKLQRNIPAVCKLGIIYDDKIIPKVWIHGSNNIHINEKLGIYILENVVQ